MIYLVLFKQKRESGPKPLPKRYFFSTSYQFPDGGIVYTTLHERRHKVMEGCGCNNNFGGCNFDLDMIIWVLIIIVIVTCMCD